MFYYDHNINLFSKILKFANESLLCFETSDFDKILIKSWMAAMDKGLFKFQLEGKQPYRNLNGKYSFVIQVRFIITNRNFILKSNVK